MYTQTGNCPKCGAGVFIPSPWTGIMPPPPTFTCGCVKGSVYTGDASETADGVPVPFTIMTKSPIEVQVQDLALAIAKLNKQQNKIEQMLQDLLGKTATKKTTLHD